MIIVNSLDSAFDYGAEMHCYAICNVCSMKYRNLLMKLSFKLI